MNVGFTGTRQGMSEAQRGALVQFLRAWHVTLFIHGDCIGSDEQADAVARELNLHRRLRPGSFEKFRAHSERFGGFFEIMPAEHPLARNVKIVRESNILLATPAGPETQRSGTWMTIRQARSDRKHVVLIFPSGQIRHE